FHWYNAAAALAGWLPIFLVGRRALIGGKTESRRLLAGLAAVTSIGFVLYVARGIDGIWRRNGAEQARQLEYIANRVLPGQPVLQLWPNVAPFQPHPTYHWFDCYIFQGPLGERVQNEYIQALRTGKV